MIVYRVIIKATGEEMFFKKMASISRNILGMDVSSSTLKHSKTLKENCYHENKFLVINKIIICE